MTGLANTIVEMVQSGNILWLAVIAVIGMVANGSRVIEFVERRKRKRLDNLIEAYGFEGLDNGFKEFIAAQIQKEHFQQIYGISADTEYRDSMIMLHNEARGHLGFEHFRRARGFLDFKDGELRVNLNKVEIGISIGSVILAMGSRSLGLPCSCCQRLSSHLC